jgi:hypothetical protein
MSEIYINNTDVAVSATVTAEEVLVSVALNQGSDGREVELRTNLGRLEWRYVGGSTWTDLGAVGAGGSMSAAEILAAMLTVDGTGSTLDADTLDGIQAEGFATAAQGVNARTPTAHKSTHASGGTDELTPADIGAATTAAVTIAQSTADAAVSDAAVALGEAQSASNGAGTALSLATQADTNATAAKTKTDFLTVTQAVNLDTMESDIAGKAATSHTHGTSGIDDAAVTLAKLAPLTAGAVIGRAVDAGTGVPVALTAAEQRAAAGLATTDTPTLAGLDITGGGEIRATVAGLVELRSTGSNQPVAIKPNGYGGFQVHGTSSGASAFAIIELINGAGSRIGFIYSEPTSGSMKLVNERSGGAFVFGAGGADRMTIFPSGGTHITIATAVDPGLASLKVDGSIEAGTYLKTGTMTVAVATASSSALAVAAGAGAQTYISDESGGATPACSDGTLWRRYSDRASIS